ncbi:tetratricopeptide repeat protein, partial [Spirillospora sp. NPDC050679]
MRVGGQAGVSGQIATGDHAVQSQQNAHYAGPGTFVQTGPGSTVNLTPAPAPAAPGQEAAQGAGPVPVYLPPQAGELFVGRQDELERLDAAFGVGDGTHAPDPQAGEGEGPVAAVVHQQPGAGRVGAVHGLGGIGKSALAAHWAATRHQPGEVVWWITADSPTAIQEGVAELGAALLGTGAAGQPLEVLFEHAVSWLCGRQGWLLVLDNVERPGYVEPLLGRLRAAAGGRVLITTRLSTGWSRITRQIIALDVLPLPQAVQLLERTVTAERPGAVLDGAEELCRELGCLPLAVEQAAGFLAENGTGPRAYLERLATYPATTYARTSPGRDDIDRTVARVWHSTLDHLVVDTPLAGIVLRVLAWWAPDAIPRALLNGLANLDEQVTQQGGTLAVQEAVAQLAAYNMITLSADGQAISAHRLVQAVARTPPPDGVDDLHRRPADITAARRHATTLLNQALPKDGEEPVGWPVWRALLPHIDALTDHAPADTDNADTALLCNQTSVFLHDQGALLRSIGYQERAQAVFEQALGEDHPYTLTSRNNLASIYQAAGDLKQAIALHEKTLADRQRVLGEDHPATLTSRNNLANTYQAAGDLERAITLHEQNLADRQRVLGHHHPNTLNSRNNLASAYQDADDLEQAIALHEQNLADQARVLGKDHPDTLNSRNNLASAYQAADDLERAIALHEQNLADQARVLGKDHPATLTSRNNLASAYQDAGDLERAITLHEQNLADRQRVLGHHHPNTLTSRNNL